MKHWDSEDWSIFAVSVGMAVFLAAFGVVLIVVAVRS